MTPKQHRETRGVFNRRNAPAGTAFEKRPTPRPVHILPVELDTLLSKLRFQIPRGMFAQAVNTLEAFIDEKQRGGSEFDGFSDPGEVPLGLASTKLLPYEVFNVLDDMHIRTVGDVKRLSDDQLLEIDRLAPTRIRKIRAAVTDLENQFLAWLTTKRSYPLKHMAAKNPPRSDSNASTRQGDPTHQPGAEVAAGGDFESLTGDGGEGKQYLQGGTER